MDNCILFTETKQKYVIMNVTDSIYKMYGIRCERNYQHILQDMNIPILLGTSLYLLVERVQWRLQEYRYCRYIHRLNWNIAFVVPVSTHCYYVSIPIILITRFSLSLTQIHGAGHIKYRHSHCKVFVEFIDDYTSVWL